MTTRRAAAAVKDAPHSAKEKEATSPTRERGEIGPPWVKFLVSGLLVLHITAVFWAPFAFASNVGASSSPFADAVMGVLRPYITAMYLDHGYFFFAPDPGPSHLVRYKLEFADGRESVEAMFPDLKTQRPRLLYHRHFMLAESLNNSFVPPTPPPEPTPPALTATSRDKARYQRERDEYQRGLALWRKQRQRYESLWKSIEEHLKHEHGAAKATLTRIEHRLATPGQVRDMQVRLDDPQSYVPLPETPPRGANR